MFTATCGCGYHIGQQRSAGSFKLSRPHTYETSFIRTDDFIVIRYFFHHCKQPLILRDLLVWGRLQGLHAWSDGSRLLQTNFYLCTVHTTKTIIQGPPWEVPISHKPMPFQPQRMLTTGLFSFLYLLAHEFIYPSPTPRKSYICSKSSSKITLSPWSLTGLPSN